MRFSPFVPHVVPGPVRGWHRGARRFADMKSSISCGVIASTREEGAEVPPDDCPGSPRPSETVGCCEMKLALNDQDPRICWPVRGYDRSHSRFFSINPMDGKGQGEEAAGGGRAGLPSALPIQGDQRGRC